MAEWLPCGPSGLSARSIGVCAGTSLIAIATPKPLLREGWCENRLPNFLPVTCEFQTLKEYNSQRQVKPYFSMLFRP